MGLRFLRIYSWFGGKGLKNIDGGLKKGGLPI